MKSWSVYNKLLSLRLGYFLYNSLSGRLLQLDERHYNLAKIIRKDGLLLRNEHNKFVDALISSGFLSTVEEERNILLRKRKERDKCCSDQSILMLTICPTLACNFDCLYCFQPDDLDRSVMNPQTINKLIDFIGYHKNAQEISVTWYGGEPTIAFDLIEILTEKILNIRSDFDNATLITNGFLLCSEKIEKLNGLRIRAVQVTLDGPEVMHDRRRPLTGGHPTYQRIIENIDILMNSSYNGSCTVRINIDESNKDIFDSFCADLSMRYINKPFSAYAAPLQAGYCKEKKVSQNADDHNYSNHNILLTKVGLPESNNINICTAVIDSAYVVAPDGFLYKCWRDIGNQNRVAGSLYNDLIDGQNSVVRQYKTVGNPYLDPKCVACNVFPVCDGGCAYYRISSKKKANSSYIECHSLYNKELEACLERYVDAYLKKEICGLLMGDLYVEKMEYGFRFIDFHWEDSDRV